MNILTKALAFFLVITSPAASQDLGFSMLSALGASILTNGDELLTDAPEMLDEFLQSAEQGETFESAEACLGALQTAVSAGAIATNILPFSSVETFEDRRGPVAKFRILFNGTKVHVEAFCDGKTLATKALAWGNGSPKPEITTRSSVDALAGMFLLLHAQGAFETDPTAVSDAEIEDDALTTDYDTHTKNEADIDTLQIPDMMIGNPDSKVTVIEYASYTCPHCASFHASAFKDLKKSYIDTDKINFVFREVYFDRYGLWASMIARCGGPSKFFDLTDLMFESQSLWTSSGEPSTITDELRKIGRLANISDDRLDACLSDNAKAKSLIAWYQEKAGADNIDSTPSFIINGKKLTNMSFAEMSEIIDAELSELSDGPGQGLTAKENEVLRVAVQQCWNVGSLSSLALETTVVVAVSLTQNGKPIVASIRQVSSEGGTSASVMQAFETARRAIIRCGARGFQLPRDKYDQWKDIKMTFDPERMRIE